MEVLKALLAKLQKYGRNVNDPAVDIVHQISLSDGSSAEQKRKGHNRANTKREVCNTGLIFIESIYSLLG